MKVNSSKNRVTVTAFVRRVGGCWEVKVIWVALDVDLTIERANKSEKELFRGWICCMLISNCYKGVGGDSFLYFVVKVFELAWMVINRVLVYRVNWMKFSVWIFIYLLMLYFWWGLVFSYIDSVVLLLDFLLSNLFRYIARKFVCLSVCWFCLWFLSYKCCYQTVNDTSLWPYKVNIKFAPE